MSGFTVACLIPPALGAALVRAVARAGGTPILDMACGGPDRWDLSALAIDDEILTVRIRAGSEKESNLAGCGLRRLILTDWDPATLAPTLERLAMPNREIWLEIRDSGEPTQVSPTLPVHGWLARGSECGGITGRESAFVQAQHLARQKKPFWIQGAIGPNTAAACRLAGAAGVVLDDALPLMRESTLPPLTRAVLASLGVEDTTVVDPDGIHPIRVAHRPDLPGAQALLMNPTESRTRLGWGDVAQWALPMGQGVGRIAATARRHGSVGRLIDAVRTTSERNIEAARTARILAEGAPLAQAHGTRLPIVQGPMTRVSDTPDFAASIAEAGALPLLALAMMGGAEAGALLDGTRARLGDRPWGVGLLGYLEEDRLGEQIAELARVSPPFALIAGGRPDQARHLETLGIPTYLHVPTPDVLRLYLEQGARRFVFEGAECGGHTGPLGGFALWEGVIDTLRETDPKILETVHLLFAGGIHDDLSAAMIATLAAPLDKARIGVLMGSAYLFTQEALDNGAIVEGFQREALACNRTTVIETGPGHRIRCAPTPFVDAFRDRDAALRAEGMTPANRTDVLDRMVTGRLRLASKAVTRKGDALVAAGPDSQRADGLFMMGEVATLTRTVRSISALHREVSEGALKVLGAKTAPRPTAPTKPPEPIAIIGIGCIVPGADDADGLWRLLLDGRSTITEIPERRWDWRLFHSSDASHRDGIRSKWGGFIDPVPFDPVGYGIPPSALGSISLPQLLALEGTARALADAGLASPAALESVRERTAAIFGVASAGDVEQMYKLRSGLPLVARPSEEELSRLPEWTEESFPGILLNVVAGRVANRFNLGGATFTVDAACASSLVALDLAVAALSLYHGVLPPPPRHRKTPGRLGRPQRPGFGPRRATPLDADNGKTTLCRSQCLRLRWCQLPRGSRPP